MFRNLCWKTRQKYRGRTSFLSSGDPAQTKTLLDLLKFKAQSVRMRRSAALSKPLKIFSNLKVLFLDFKEPQRNGELLRVQMLTYTAFGHLKMSEYHSIRSTVSV